MSRPQGICFHVPSTSLCCGSFFGRHTCLDGHVAGDPRGVPHDQSPSLEVARVVVRVDKDNHVKEAVPMTKDEAAATSNVIPIRANKATQRASEKKWGTAVMVTCGAVQNFVCAVSIL